MINITYFVHASTPDGENKLSSGWHDCGLSVTGIKQASELKQHTGKFSYDVVFCSDLKRAVQSAELAFEGVKIVKDRRLRECNYGRFNAQPSAIVEPMLEECVTSRFPGGESCEDVKARLDDFLGFLKKNYDGKNVAIVSHKTPQLALGVLLKGKTWEQAFKEDWRKAKAWQPGWEYVIR